MTKRILPKNKDLPSFSKTVPDQKPLTKDSPNKKHQSNVIDFINYRIRKNKNSSITPLFS